MNNGDGSDDDGKKNQQTQYIRYEKDIINGYINKYVCERESVSVFRILIFSFFEQNDAE